MSDEKLFHYLASRIQTRETSIHTIAIITSSASLLLFVLYFSGDFSSTIQDEVIVRLLGILLPLIGFSYFEVVFGTQQRWDYENLKKIIDKDKSAFTQSEVDEIIFGKSRALVLPKMALWRILLALPLVIWITFDQELGWRILTLVCAGVIIVLLMAKVERGKNLFLKSENNSETMDN